MIIKPIKQEEIQMPILRKKTYKSPWPMRPDMESIRIIFVQKYLN